MRKRRNQYHGLQDLQLIEIHQNIWVLFSPKQQIQKRDDPDRVEMFRLGGGGPIEFVATSRPAIARGLRFQLQSSWHSSLPGKNYRSLCTIKFRQQFDVCLYMYVCMCTLKWDHKRLAVAAERGDCANGERQGDESRCCKTGDADNRPSVQGWPMGRHNTHKYSLTFHNLPPPPPPGSLPCLNCPARQEWAHINNTTNKEKVSAEKKVWVDRGKMWELQWYFFSPATMSHCFSEEGWTGGKKWFKKKMLELWNVWVSIITLIFSYFKHPL